MRGDAKSCNLSARGVVGRFAYVKHEIACSAFLRQAFVSWSGNCLSDQLLAADPRNCSKGEGVLARRVAITRGVSPSMATCELTHLSRQVISIAEYCKLRNICQITVFL